MRSLFILPLVLIPLASSQNQNPVVSHGTSELSVLSHKWSKARQVPQRITIPIRHQRNRFSFRLAKTRNASNASTIPEGRDPAADTIDGRAAALERSSSREARSQTKLVDGFSYRLRLKNESLKPIEIVFWEYQFIDVATPDIVTRRQFLCGLNLRPGKEKELIAFSLAGPSRVVSVQTLANKIEKPPLERVLINRIEYADGTIWQRQDWSFAEIRLSYRNAIATPWTEMCRGL